MSFQIIRAEDRTQRMIEWFSGMCRSITDFIPGSKVRTKLETVAVEMEAQDLAFYQAVKKAIPVSIYQAFNFTLLPAVKAVGKVTFTASPTPTADILIPKGTRVATPETDSSKEIIYEVIADSYLLANTTTLQVDIQAVIAGSTSNTPASTITVMKTTITGLTAVTNVVALTNGQDRETEDARRLRFQQYINTLVRGTAAAIEYGAKTAQILDGNGNIAERIAAAKIIEPYLANPTLPAGNIYCYVYNGTGSTSANVIAEAQRIVDGYVMDDGTIVPGYKAAGVVCTVLGAIEMPTNVSMTVTALPGKTTADKAALKSTIETAVATHISTLQMGETLLRSKIIDIVMGTEGVYNVSVTLPANDVTVAQDHIILPGTMTATVS